MERQLGLPRSSQGLSGTQNKEEKLLSDSLQVQINNLKLSNKKLLEKNNLLTEQLEKKKRELNLVNKTTYLYKNNNLNQQNANKISLNTHDIDVIPGKTSLKDSVSLRQSNPPPPVVQETPPPPIIDNSLLELAKGQKAR